MQDTLVFIAVEYNESTEVEINDNGVIENHDELVNNGHTTDVAVAVDDSEHNRNVISNDMIVEEEDDMWREEFNEMESGDSIEL